MNRFVPLLALLVSSTLPTAAGDLVWDPLPDLPADPGVAGPFVGIHRGTLLVAGGANFPVPVWENDKVWHDEVYALALERENARWEKAGSLPRPLGYGTTVSVPEGVVCIGGNDVDQVYREVFLLAWKEGSLECTKLPDLPIPLCYASSARLGRYLYVAGGQTGPGLETATKTFLRLDWSKFGQEKSLTWEELPPWEGPERAFPSLASLEQADSLYLIGGRRETSEGEVEFLSDLHSYEPGIGWKRLSDLPRPVAAGCAVALEDGRIIVPAGADGSLFLRSDVLKDDHPGFPRSMLVYDIETDSWKIDESLPRNQVTTEAVPWNDGFVLASGEIRPRVRTRAVWKVSRRK